MMSFYNIIYYMNIFGDVYFMRILLDARGASWYNGTGIGTYTFNLIESMINTISFDNSFHLFCSGEKEEAFNKNNTKIIMSSKKHQHFFEDYYIPLYANKESIDLYHIPQNGIGLNGKGNFLKIVTIHDLIPYILPETVGKNYLKDFLKDMPTIINNADGILTVSEHSKKDILKFFPSFPSERIIVTPLAANKSFKPLNKVNCKQKVKSRYNINNPFLLYLGGFSLRKNVKLLIDVFNNIFSSLNAEFDLVIAGSLKDEGLKLKEHTNNLDGRDHIKFIGFVEDEFLPTLYNACELFVYPSLYEGFGLPPLEAMSCMTPIITTNITSIPEIVKNSYILVEPNNKHELENKLVTLLNNDKLRYALGKDCFENSKNFTWEKTAEKTLNAYKFFYNLGKKNI